MRRLALGLLATAALSAGFTQIASAADLPVKAAPFAVVAPAYNWTGLYIGIEGGGVWSRSRHVNADTPNQGLEIASFNANGGLFGGTVGFNYQTGPAVFGIEGDWSWANVNGGAVVNAPFNQTFRDETQERSLATIRGRIGYAWDRWLVFATGGVAFANVESRQFSPAIGQTDSKTMTGGVFGVGLEAALWQNWSVKLEYLYVNFATSRFFDPPNFCCVRTDVSLSNNILRAGLNYKFNWAAPVVAKN
jgi:outer membrane immunogenic protein